MSNVTTLKTRRRQRNGHTVELQTDWVCLQCGHHFDALVDADAFWCGDDCTGKHPEDTP